MPRPLLLPFVLSALLLAACAGPSGDAVRRDVAQAQPFPWCDREIRAARSQPVPKGASPQEARILRGRHMSQACASAWQESNSVRVPLGGGERIPDPLPRPRPE